MKRAFILIYHAEGPRGTQMRGQVLSSPSTMYGAQKPVPYVGVNPTVFIDHIAIE